MNERIAAAILVGGGSRRMGCDKALLRLPDQRTALEATIAAAKTAADHVFMVADTAIHGETLLRTLRDPPAMLVDRDPGAGPLAALHTALSGAGHCRAVLLLAVDAPLAAPALLRMLCAAGSGSGSAQLPLPAVDRPDRAEIVVAMLQGEPQPMPGLFAVSITETVRDLLDRGTRSLRALIASDRVATLRLDEQLTRSLDPLLLSFAVANTPEQWAALCARAAAQRVAR